MSTITVAKLRTDFFSYLFGEDQKGFLCIATAAAEKKSFKQHFFEWPKQKDEVSTFIEQVSKSLNVWFGVTLYDAKRRSKETSLPVNIVWADLDTVTPQECDPKPSVALKSSPGRFQAFWRLDCERLPPDVCEDYSRKVAYQVGADKSGWDLTQLLRVPFTKNFKYEDEPEVEIVYIFEVRAPQSIFEEMPDPRIVDVEASPLEAAPDDMPDVMELPDASSIAYKYAMKLQSTGFHTLYSDPPNEGADWSRLMWRLIMICIENGMSNVETFAVCMAAKCNKYQRDNRPPSYLWREIIKAEGMSKKSINFSGKIKPLVMPLLVDPKEPPDNFIAEYKSWAESATDAVPEYHELSCFILLSALVSAGLYTNTTWGELVPNLWGLVLGDSTLTRKTTAMNMAKDILLDIDTEILLATDGSAEGLVTALSNRPERVSMFFRDEVTGFFDAINRKDYLASMPELLTQLYDVPKVLIRQLRKDSIVINKPFFIFFGGGIKEKVHTLLNEEYVLSGFLPRFLVVSGDTDLTKLRRTGPANSTGVASKDNLIDKLRRIHTIYNRQAEIIIAGQTTNIPRRFEARLTAGAWETFGDFEERLTKIAAESPNSTLALPTFTRLAFSMLKMGMILASVDKEPNAKGFITVNEQHIKEAAFYVQKWGNHSIALIENTGISYTERMLQKVITLIMKHPGISRSRIMINSKLSAREMEEIYKTLYERGLITIEKEGKGQRFFAVES